MSYMRRFDSAWGGKAGKKTFDELGFTKEQRAERYRAEYLRREERRFKFTSTSDVEESRPSVIDDDAMVASVDRDRKVTPILIEARQSPERPPSVSDTEKSGRNDEALQGAKPAGRSRKKLPPGGS